MKTALPTPLFSPSQKLIQSILARMEDRLVEHRKESKYKDYYLPDLPNKKYFTQLLSVAFWAGLEREESQELRFSLAFAPRPPGAGYYPLETPVPFSRESIRKLANAYEGTITHFGIECNKEGNLNIWGGLQYPGEGICIIDAVEPSTLVVRYTPETIAILKGDSTTFLPTGHVHRMPVDLLNLIIGEFPPDAAREESESTVLLLVDLARKIRTHGHGGIVLVVPADDESWRDSLEQRYAIDPGFDQSGQRDALDARPGRGRLSATLSLETRYIHDWRDEYIKRAGKLSDIREAAQDRLVRLALIDGALVLTTDRRVVGFGARLVRPKSRVQHGSVEEWDPIRNRSLGPRDVKSLGGTRHQSAANFVADNRWAVALVISQDGRVSVFTKSQGVAIRFIPGVEVLFL